METTETSADNRNLKVSKAVNNNDNQKEMLKIRRKRNMFATDLYQARENTWFHLPFSIKAVLSTQAQTQYFHGASLTFLLIVGIVHGLAQSFQIFVDETNGYLPVGFIGECHFGYQCYLRCQVE